MPSTFGQWLIVILVLLVGLLGWWMWRSRQSATRPVDSNVEGDPVAGVSDVPAPATAVVDQAHPAAVVDEAPAPAAVTDEPAPVGHDAPPAAATLAANATPLPSADEHLDETRADAEPVHVEELVSAEPVHVEEPAATEPVHVEEPAAVVTEAEPVVPAGQHAPEADEDVTPAVVPAPRPAVEDTFTPVAPTTPTEPETAVTAPAAANGAVAANGSEAADDFRRIQGIGPKLAAALQAAGIRTYQQLGDLDEAALRATVRAAGLRAAASLATWPQQARVLAGARAEADQVLPAGASEDA